MTEKNQVQEQVKKNEVPPQGCWASSLSHWMETLGLTQNLLERLYPTFGLGTSGEPPGGSENYCG